MEIIHAENLTKKFGDFTAVENLTFGVNKGEVFGLLGPNGAGKTTTARMLCCLISKTSGNARIADLDCSDKESAIKIRKMIGIVHENVGLYETMTAYENLEFFGRMYETPEDLLRANIEKYMKMLDIWQIKDRPVYSFSKGMKQKVAVVRSLVHDPEILFMDEPTANLDPEASKIIRDVILELKKENRTIFLNTHNLDEAQRICDRIGILKKRLIAVDTPSNLVDSISRRITTIVLESVNERILKAVQSYNLRNLTVEDNRLLVEMENPERDTPAIINAISASGGMIKSVNETRSTLEEAYLKLVKEDQ